MMLSNRWCFFFCFFFLCRTDATHALTTSPRIRLLLAQSQPCKGWNPTVCLRPNPERGPRGNQERNENPTSKQSALFSSRPYLSRLIRVGPTTEFGLTKVITEGRFGHFGPQLITRYSFLFTSHLLSHQRR